VGGERIVMHVQFNVESRLGGVAFVVTRKLGYLPLVGDVVTFGVDEFSVVERVEWVLHEDGDPTVLIHSRLSDRFGH